MKEFTVPLSEDTQAFVDRKVTEGGYESVVDYLHALLGREQARQQLRDMIQEGIDSGDSGLSHEEFSQRIGASRA
ncbi:MAG: hypothetical protein QM606_04805 [Leucobacter sp.]